MENNLPSFDLGFCYLPPPPPLAFWRKGKKQEKKKKELQHLAYV